MAAGWADRFGADIYRYLLAVVAAVVFAAVADRAVVAVADFAVVAAEALLVLAAGLVSVAADPAAPLEDAPLAGAALPAAPLTLGTASFVTGASPAPSILMASAPDAAGLNGGGAAAKPGWLQEAPASGVT